MTSIELKTLAKAYYENVKRSQDIYEACAKFDLYVDDEKDPLVRAVEKILDSFAGDMTDALCELAYNGKVTLYNPEATYTNADDVIDSYVEWLDREMEEGR